ncbi:hypothetical protein PTT_17740 [Pyrenophora teres f. teres 0-1]|uniref:Uncharacterized protein n=1 Tax=Pyrenophora teres f. teres (strain 0-1) TaxID=861557 RepID=E3S564_PYRTT|nr:hypothetical protein PTT_17740 [Pyrenophora teres f. teres 0-1]
MSYDTGVMSSVPKPDTQSAPYIWTHQDLSTKLMAAIGDEYYFIHLGQRILQTRKCNNSGLKSLAMPLADRCIQVGNYNKQHVYAFLTMQTSQIELYWFKGALPMPIRWESLQNRVILENHRYGTLHENGALENGLKFERTNKSPYCSMNPVEPQKADEHWFRALMCYYFLAGKMVKELVDYPRFFEDLKETCTLLQSAEPTVEQMAGYGPRLVRKAIVSGNYFQVATMKETSSPFYQAHALSRSKYDITSAMITPTSMGNDGKKRKLDETAASKTEDQKRPRDKRTKLELLSELEERDFDVKYYVPQVASLNPQISLLHSQSERDKSEHAN